MEHKGAKQVAEWKKEQVKEISGLFRKWPIIGIVNMENLPALQLLRIKNNLRDVLVLKMINKSLLLRALDELSKDMKNIDKVKEQIKGMPALIFTKESPFKLYKTLKKSKSKAPAKAGQEAPKDIVIKAGPTQFQPGPIIGELGRAGLKTKVEGGKITIAADKVLVKEGEVINAVAADVLSKLGVEPMEIGLNLLFTYENGEILGKNVLDVDEELYLNTLKRYVSEAVNLSIEIGYITKENVEMLIAKGYREAKALNEKSDAFTNEVKSEITEAEKSAKALKQKVPENVEEEPVKEEVKEVKEKPKVEEKPAEKKEELVKEEVKIEEAKPEEVKEVKEKPKVEEKPVEKKEEPVKEEVEKEEAEEKPKEEKQEELIEEKPVEEQLNEEAESLETKKKKNKEFEEAEKQAQEIIQQAQDRIIKGNR